VKDCIPWERPHAGAGEELDKEGIAEAKHYELTMTTIPHPLHCLEERDEVEESGVKLSLEPIMPVQPSYKLFSECIACNQKLEKYR